MSNVPDDWGSYYRDCPLCGHRYHASEGGCGCEEMAEAMRDEERARWHERGFEAAKAKHVPLEVSAEESERAWLDCRDDELRSLLPLRERNEAFLGGWEAWGEGVEG